MLQFCRWQLRVYLHSVSRCCLPKFKVIQGHRPWCQSKPNSNFERISYRFEILTLENSLFYHLPCLTPPSGGTPWDINIIYTPLKSAFSGLQFRHRHYGSIFIHLAVVIVAPPRKKKFAKSGKIPTTFDLKAVQGHRSWCQWKAHMWLPISH